MKKPYIAVLALLIPGIISCSSQKKADAESASADTRSMVSKVVRPIRSTPIAAIPKATAFRMNGDYADQVAITLNDDGTLAYYPDPKDITESSRPVDLGNGWWLNRQGLSDKSVFTRYTFADYAALKSVPTHAQLIESIIPDAKITGFQELPYNVTDAMEHLDSIRVYVTEPHRKPSIMRPIPD